MSVNPEPFELICIKRYFYCLDHAQKEGFDRFLILDTDFLAMAGLEDFVLRTCRADQVGISRGNPNSSRAPHYSPHCSLWTVAHLRDFVAWLPSYMQDSGALEARYGEDGQYPLQLSDMTLLWDWAQARNIDCKDLAAPSDGGCIDHNIMQSIQGNSVFRDFMGVKALRSTGEPARFVGSLADDTPVTFFGLHFQGRAKRVMANFSKGNLWSAYAYLGGLKLTREVKKKFL